MTITGEIVNTEAAALLEVLAERRFFLRHTMRDLTDEQAARRTTASELCLGGLIKHVTEVERAWTAFLVEGAAAMEVSEAGWENQFRLVPGETLAGVLKEYAETAARTEEIVAGLPDLEESHPLPEQPWFEAGASWSNRRVLLHMIGETAQHAGHADIIRESLDGAKTMG